MDGVLDAPRRVLVRAHALKKRRGMQRGEVVWLFALPE
jgi:hypothetical protein